MANLDLPSLSVGDTFRLLSDGKSYTYEITQLKDQEGYFSCEYLEGDTDNLIENNRYAVTFGVYE